jgi:phage-related protein
MDSNFQNIYKHIKPQRVNINEYMSLRFTSLTTRKIKWMIGKDKNLVDMLKKYCIKIGGTTLIP